MKNTKKVLAIVLAIALTLALSVTAFAATITKAEGVTGPASIKVTLPTVGEGVTANNTYKIYKVFDAQTTAENEAITYRLVAGKTEAPEGFSVDAKGYVTYDDPNGNGEFTDAIIKNIANYVKESDVVATVKTTSEDTEFTVTGLPYGYYYIDTTTGSLVTIDSTNPNAEVSDKNEYPPVDKKITGASSIDEKGKKAIAEVGSVVSYEASIVVKKGAENYVFHDTMTAGLEYNGDIKVYIGETEIAPEGHFTVGAADGDTLTVSFDNDYIKTLVKVDDDDEETVIVFKYTATVTSNALTRDPAKNTAYISYGHTPGDNHTPPVVTEVYNAKITITKNDNKNQPLAGAGFVLQNSDGDFYTLVNEKDVVWVETIEEADEYFSDADGKIKPFTGLADGTYTLIEKTVPAGYNPAADTTFTIAANDYTVENLEQEATVINNEGPELPSTGGIGTTLFYVIGTMLVLAAAVVLIARRRTAANAL